MTVTELEYMSVVMESPPRKVVTAPVATPEVTAPVATPEVVAMDTEVYDTVY